MINFIVSRLKAFKYAWDGLVDLLLYQEPVLVHLAAIVVALGTAWFLDFPTWKWVAIVFCIGFTLTTEALNTAVEYVVDLVSPEYHVLAGKAKDIAAAGVMLSAMTSAIIFGILIYDSLA
ncbi:diacylglycerol kinase family protein [Neolewinella aurantiaca]|uniref:Diacylglycerol kinase family protein n=1 Tax=Neolewinella aurantiaca TaxID=2602767 RepID=A0A5C7FLZ9_9BACT|nr:diacylglycerol kinase family protein [Neolewinella aurantiaca]TXF91740.1 diacylglycerol kinase family protein [Neolewinella aurantiaca]